MLFFFGHQAFKYEEDFPNAMKGYEMASKLDPEWEQPKEELADLKKRLKASVELTQNKVGKWRKE